jgi:Rap1a immunity proteins
MEMTNQFIAGSSLGYCYGYMEGVVDAYDGRTFCIPDGTTAAQFGDVAIQYLRRSSVGVLQGRDAAHMVAEALKIAYPCR